ncbi:MAG: hypothetical protein KC933_37020, partial [Myxococcales bacterium]|nr:hypothetical protein [Myxococcales bacterium]
SSFGLGVLGRAQVELEGLAVDAARIGGVSVVEEGRLAARHLWTEAGPGSSGHVVVVGEKAYANLRNVRIRGGVIAGLDVAEGEVDVTDAVIRDIQPSPTDLRGGSGIIVRAGGQVRLERGVLLRTRGYGVEARDTESLAEVIDVRVTDVPGWVADGDNGIGLGADSLAEIHVSRVQVERVHGFGALLRGGLLTGDDLLVQQMLPQDANDAYGRGLEFGRSAVVDLTRVWVRDAMNIGVLCLDIGTRVTLRDLRVDRTTRSPACHEFSCNTGAADGLTAMLEADVSATRFLIQDNGQYGVRVVNRTVLLLRDGRVARNAVGAQVINADFDLSNLMEGVVYEDNPEPVSVLSD